MRQPQLLCLPQVSSKQKVHVQGKMDELKVNLDLVQKLRKELESESVSRQRQEQVSSKLQDEYDVLLKKLAEAELHIDRLRFGANVDVHKHFVITHSSQRRQKRGTPLVPQPLQARRGPHGETGSSPNKAHRDGNTGSGESVPLFQATGHTASLSTLSSSTAVADRALQDENSANTVSEVSSLAHDGEKTGDVFTNGEIEQSHNSTESFGSRRDSDIIQNTRSLSLISQTTDDDATLFSPSTDQADDLSQLSLTTITDRASAESIQMVHFFHIHDLQEKISDLEKKLGTDGGASVDDVLSALTAIQNDHQQLVRDVTASQEGLQALNLRFGGKASNHIARCQEALESELSQLTENLGHLQELLHSKGATLLPSASATESALCSPEANTSRSTSCDISIECSPSDLSSDSLNSPALPEKYFSQSHHEDHMMSCNHLPDSPLSVCSQQDYMMTSCDSLSRQPSRDSLEPLETITEQTIQAPPHSLHHPHTSTVSSQYSVDNKARASHFTQAPPHTSTIDTKVYTEPDKVANHLEDQRPRSHTQILHAPPTRHTHFRSTSPPLDYSSHHSEARLPSTYCTPRPFSEMTLPGDGDSGFAGSYMPRPSTMASYYTAASDGSEAGAGGEGGAGGGEATQNGDVSEEKLPSLTIAAIEALRTELAELKKEVMMSSRRRESSASTSHSYYSTVSHSYSPILHSTPTKRSDIAQHPPPRTTTPSATSQHRDKTLGQAYTASYSLICAITPTHSPLQTPTRQTHEYKPDLPVSSYSAITPTHSPLQTPTRQTHKYKPDLPVSSYSAITPTQSPLQTPTRQTHKYKPDLPVSSYSAITPTQSPVHTPTIDRSIYAPTKRTHNCKPDLPVSATSLLTASPAAVRVLATPVRSTTAITTPVSTPIHRRDGSHDALTNATPVLHDRVTGSHDPLTITPVSHDRVTGSHDTRGKLNTGAQVISSPTSNVSSGRNQHGTLSDATNEISPPSVQTPNRLRQSKLKPKASSYKQTNLNRITSPSVRPDRQSSVESASHRDSRYHHGSDTSQTSASDLGEVEPRPSFSVRRHSVPVAPSYTTSSQYQYPTRTEAYNKSSLHTTYKPSRTHDYHSPIAHSSRNVHSSKVRHTPAVRSDSSKVRQFSTPTAVRSDRAYHDSTPSTDAESHAERHFNSPSASKFSSANRYAEVGDLTSSISPPRRGFDSPSSTPARDSHYSQVPPHTIAASKPYSHPSIRRSGTASFKPRSLHREMPRDYHRGGEKTPENSRFQTRLENSSSACGMEESDQYHSQPEIRHIRTSEQHTATRHHTREQKPAFRSILLTPSGRRVRSSNVVRVVSSSSIPRRVSDEGLEYYSEPLVLTPGASSSRRKRRVGRSVGGGQRRVRTVLVRPNSVEEVYLLREGDELSSSGSEDSIHVLDHTTAVELEEACRLARQLERRAQRLKTSLHSELTQHGHTPHKY